MALDEPKDTDNIETVNNIRVAIDARIADIAKDITLEKRDKGLVLTGISTNNC